LTAEQGRAIVATRKQRNDMEWLILTAVILTVAGNLLNTFLILHFAARVEALIEQVEEENFDKEDDDFKGLEK
jgi:H+/gluconate symporter-like permease